MAGSKQQDKVQTKAKKVRSNDDLQVLRMVLEDNPSLKDRVAKRIEKELAKRGINIREKVEELGKAEEDRQLKASEERMKKRTSKR